MTDEEYINKWGRDNLIRWSESHFEKVTIPDQDKRFLIEVGLPRRVELIGLWLFEPSDNILMDRLIVGQINLLGPITVNASGDTYQEAKDGDRTLLNSSVRHLGEFLTVFKFATYREPFSQIEEMEKYLRKLDSRAFQENWTSFFGEWYGSVSDNNCKVFFVEPSIILDMGISGFPSHLRNLQMRIPQSKVPLLASWGLGKNAILCREEKRERLISGDLDKITHDFKADLYQKTTLSIRSGIKKPTEVKLDIKPYRGLGDIYLNSSLNQIVTLLGDQYVSFNKLTSSFGFSLYYENLGLILNFEDDLLLSIETYFNLSEEFMGEIFEGAPAKSVLPKIKKLDPNCLILSSGLLSLRFGFGLTFYHLYPLDEAGCIGVIVFPEGYYDGLLPKLKTYSALPDKIPMEKGLIGDLW